MKRLFHVFAAKRLLAIAIVAVMLASSLAVGSLVYQHGTAHACGASAVAGSTTTVSIVGGPGGSSAAIISFSLWYDSCTGENYGSANVTAGSVSSHLAISVTRLSGPDGGQTTATNANCASTGICNSPRVHSPNNKAYVQISTEDVLIDTSAF